MQELEERARKRAVKGGGRGSGVGEETDEDGDGREEEEWKFKRQALGANVVVKGGKPGAFSSWVRKSEREGGRGEGEG